MRWQRGTSDADIEDRRGAGESAPFPAFRRPAPPAGLAPARLHPARHQ